MSLCIKKCPKARKAKFWIFSTNCHTYSTWETVCRTKNFIKQKMQGAGSFEAPPNAMQGKKLSKIKALSLTVKKLWLKNLKNEYP